MLEALWSHIGSYKHRNGEEFYLGRRSFKFRQVSDLDIIGTKRVARYYRYLLDDMNCYTH